jgi:hypothetical protein
MKNHWTINVRRKARGASRCPAACPSSLYQVCSWEAYTWCLLLDHRRRLHIPFLHPLHAICVTPPPFPHFLIIFPDSFHFIFLLFLFIYSFGFYLFRRSPLFSTIFSQFSFLHLFFHLFTTFSFSIHTLFLFFFFLLAIHLLPCRLISLPIFFF